MKHPYYHTTGDILNQIIYSTNQNNHNPTLHQNVRTRPQRCQHRRPSSKRRPRPFRFPQRDYRCSGDCEVELWRCLQGYAHHKSILTTGVTLGRFEPLLTRMTHTGELQSVDGYMNIALEGTREFVDGKMRRSYGDAFVRGNNGRLNSY